MSINTDDNPDTSLIDKIVIVCGTPCNCCESVILFE